MKPIFPIIISAFVIFVFTSSGCNKEKHLFNEIKSQIAGKWKLEYVKGGFIANYYRSFHNEDVTWQFHSGTRIVQNYNGTINTDATIVWEKATAVNSGGNEVFIIKFSDKRGYPYNYIVHDVTSDSLVLRDNAIDGQHYQFSKAF